MMAGDQPRAAAAAYEALLVAAESSAARSSRLIQPDCAEDGLAAFSRRKSRTPNAIRAMAFARTAKQRRETTMSGCLCFDKLGPLGTEGSREQLLTGDDTGRLALNGNSKFSRRLAVTVGYVLEMAPRCATASCKGLATIRLQGEEVGFEVHARITSNDEISVNII